MSNKIIDIDTRLFNFINNTLKCKLLDWIMPFFTHVGGFVGSIGICLILMLFVPIVPGTKVIGAVFISQVVTQMIKKIANRIRPHIALPKVNISSKLMLYDPSFPSAHTATVTAWATVLAYFVPITTPWLVIVCTLVGISRVYLGQHYPVDVFIGAFIGISSGILVSIF